MGYDIPVLGVYISSQCQLFLYHILVSALDAKVAQATLADISKAKKKAKKILLFKYIFLAKIYFRAICGWNS